MHSTNARKRLPSDVDKTPAKRGRPKANVLYCYPLIPIPNVGNDDISNARNLNLKTRDGT